LAAVTAALLLAACGGDPVDLSRGIECFPEEGRQWIASADRAAAAAQVMEQPGGAATVYVDRSGSMVGYIRGATAQEQPLQDLVLGLGGMLQRQQLSTDFRAFGSRVTGPLPKAEVLATEGFYACDNCDNQTSQLDEPLKQIAADPNRMALMISDLWFDSQAVAGSGLTRLNQPVSEILSSGRSVAVYGIAAPFRGRPGGGATEFQGQLPLYLIAVGSAGQLARFHDAMRNAPMRLIRDGVKSGEVKRSLFSLTPAVDNRSLAAPFGEVDQQGMGSIAVHELPPQVSLQQFRFRPAEAAESRAAEGTGPVWEGPRAEAFAPGAVWEGSFRPRTQIWERSSPPCTQEEWRPGPAVPTALWQAAGDRHRFRLAPDMLIGELSPGTIYLISGELLQTELSERPAATQWMRDWSFAGQPNPQRMLPNGRAFHPTQNLEELAHHLESALRNLIKRRERPVQGFAVLVTVEQ